MGTPLKNRIAKTAMLGCEPVLGAPAGPTIEKGICAAVDVTEAKNAETKLVEQKLQLDTALNNMSQGLLMFGPDARVVLCNGRYIEMYNLLPEFVKPGRTLRELLEHRRERGSFTGDADVYCREVFDSMVQGKTWARNIELPDGRSVHSLNSPMVNGGWISTHEDITERKKAEARIAHLALHDPLTGLPNRAAFNDVFAATIAKARANNETFAVLCMDLDRFKEINDVFGHLVGDHVLRQVGQRLQIAAEGEFVARIGGDELTVIATHAVQPETAAALAERLVAAIGEEFDVSGRKLRIGLSVGVALYPADASESAALLTNADAALYRGKADGRGVVRFFEPEMDKQLRERRALQHDLQVALSRGEISLFYQPQAKLNGEIIGFEALARWAHPERGYVSPGTFIPVAEQSGIILPLGEWVLREACREAASWANPLQIAVNLSPAQLRHGDLPALVHTILLETGLSAGRLELEITEGMLIGDFSFALSTLRRLKSLGVRIAMDDFGTGYSSLSYLHSFPFDKIKIDQSFISDIDRNPQSAAIVRAVIGLAHGLHLPVVAEGVETSGQIEFLGREFCDEVQGYFIGRPHPISDYAQVVGKPLALRHCSPRLRTGCA